MKVGGMKVGGVSAIQIQKTSFLFGIALNLHYLYQRMKVGGVSAIQIQKTSFLFGIALNLHYLCSGIRHATTWTVLI